METAQPAPGTLLFRADAGAALGVGHLLRCLALAQAWQEAGGSVELAATEAPSAVLAKWENETDASIVRLEAPMGSRQDAERTAERCRARQGAWLVLDGYQFSADYRRWLKESMGGTRLLVIDDLADSDLGAADLILNPNAYATSELYGGIRPAQLLGARFALLRREFRDQRIERSKPPGPAREILIVMGGGDAGNLSADLARLVARYRGVRLRLSILVGPANPHFAALQGLDVAPHELRLCVNPADLRGEFEAADLAITAAGGTCWELARAGLPMFLVVAAENQRRVASALVQLGVAEQLSDLAAAPEENLGRVARLIEDEAAREKLGRKARLLVDGRGAERAALALQTFPVTLRPAALSDARCLFEWANDPAVRAAAFRSDPISWESHLAWFEARLRSAACRIYLGSDETGSLLGPVRFEWGPAGVATVSVSLAAAHRGRGLAARLVRAGVARFLEDEPSVTTVQAWIKPENFASQRTFRNAGFRPGMAVPPEVPSAVGWRYERAPRQAAPR